MVAFHRSAEKSLWPAVANSQLGWQLTLHPSRCRFAARLSSGVRSHPSAITSMSKKNLIATALVTFAAFVVFSLVRGASYLEAPLIGGLPFGNVLVGLGLCALAGAAVALSARGTTLRAASLVSLVDAALWLPASVVLAGNFQLNFGGGRGPVWLAMTVAVVACACSTLLWALLASVLVKIRGAGKA